jgi:hypothetical protein
MARQWLADGVLIQENGTRQYVSEGVLIQEMAADASAPSNSVIPVFVNHYCTQGMM